MDRTRSVGRENFFAGTVERDARLLFQPLAGRQAGGETITDLPTSIRLPLFVVKCDRMKLLPRYIVAGALARALGAPS